MTVLGKLIYLGVVLLVGGFLTRWVIPGAYVRLARFLGFQMKWTPIAAKRVARFKRIKRGYWSFVTLSTLFVISLFLEVIVNEKPLFIKYGSNWSCPAVVDWADRLLVFTGFSTFNAQHEYGQPGSKEVDYELFARCCDDPSAIEASVAEAKGRYESAREKFLKLDPPGPDAREFAKARYEQRQATHAKRKEQYEIVSRARGEFEAGAAYILPTLYPFSPTSFRYDLEKTPPNRPSLARNLLLGTTPTGRDVLVLMVYGFRVSLSFALLVATCGYAFGILVGGVQGYFGGWIDILTQRLVEIWGSIPFLLTILLIASMIKPTFIVLAILLMVLRSWVGITYYVRGEFYREKAKDYVQAAIGAGVSDWKIITRHILPNALVPVVTFAPFGIVGIISVLVSLDYLGFGLPTGTPSWGELLRLGLESFTSYPHLVIAPVVALASTLFMVVMVGEAVREAFDPKVFSRLR
jgi:microcin C transport system permease protein